MRTARFSVSLIAQAQRETLSTRSARSALLLAWSTLVLVLTAPSALARPPSSLDFTPELDKGRLGEGRQAYRERADHQRARDAYEIFKELSQQNPDDSTAAWHYGLACYYMGRRVVKDHEARKAVYAEGRDVAARALEVDPDCGPCHLVTAVNHALWGQEEGILRTIVGLPKVKRHLKKAAEFDPAFGGAAAYRIQSAIAQKVPRMFGGGKKKAKEFIVKALRVAPYEPLNYELLVDILIEQYDNPKAAVAVAKRGLSVPPPGPEYVESLDALEFLQQVVERYDTSQASGG